MRMRPVSAVHIRVSHWPAGGVVGRKLSQLNRCHYQEVWRHQMRHMHLCLCECKRHTYASVFKLFRGEITTAL